MERRREPRFLCNQPARVRLLGPGASEQIFSAVLSEISGRGARLIVPCCLPLNTPVRIDVGHTLLLGDICYCRPDGNLHYVGVTLAHSLTGVSSLDPLIENLGERPSRPETVG